MPAKGLRRLWNRGVLVAMHVLPGPLRRRLGWWRWDELMRGHRYANALWEHEASHRLPAAKLWRRGLLPSLRTPSEQLWPAAFKSLADRSTSDYEWYRLPDSELAAWVGMWQAHPQAGVCLNKALLGLVHKGEAARVDLLLSTGAGRDEGSDLPEALFESLWGRLRPLEVTLDLWRRVREAGLPVQSWEEWARTSSGRMPNRWTPKDMEFWSQSDLPLPTGDAMLRHALAWVNDPPVSVHSDEDREVETAIQSLRWFKRHGDLPSGAATRLLQEWLSTARPGNEEYYQRGVCMWLDELLSGGLPPRPVVGPQWKNMRGTADDGPQPWSHWWARCPFFEAIPLECVERLFDEPDAWSAVNKDGETIRDIIARRIHDARRQQRDSGLERVQSWVLASSMDAVLPDAPVPTPSSKLRTRTRF